MATIRQINQILDDGLSLKLITESYSELSAMKLKRIRTGIERNRQFFQEITQILHDLKMVAGQKHGLSEKLDKMVEKNGRTISVILTSNYRFYGDVNNQLIRYFMVETSKIVTDKVVVGKTGLDFLAAIRYLHSYQKIKFAKDIPTEDELNNLVSLVRDYKQVIIYHSQFKSVLTQLPTQTDLAQASSTAQQRASSGELIDFILEPEIDKMMDFFDSQMLTLLLEAAFLESELSRTAARLVAMDQGEINANEFISSTRRILLSARRSKLNAQILDTFGSFMVWKKRSEANLSTLSDLSNL